MTDAALAVPRPFDPESIPADGTERRIAAELQEREKLAAEFGLLGLKSLSADLVLTRWRGDGVRIEGRVFAELTQACVVTLDPVDQIVEETFERHLVPAGSALAEASQRRGEVVVDPDEDDPPDIFEGTIDLGAVVEEEFALAIDPYPRAPGAVLDEVPEETEDEPAESPFAALAALSRTPKDDK